MVIISFNIVDTVIVYMQVDVHESRIVIRIPVIVSLYSSYDSINAVLVSVLCVVVSW